MALVKCKECGKDISDQTEKCIHCGAKNENQKVVKNNTKAAVTYIVFVMIVVFLTIIYVFG